MSADSDANCVIHRDIRATYSAQGIVVCDACYLQYRAEYNHGSNTQLLSRPFLQQLIRASADRFEELHAEIQ